MEKKQTAVEFLIEKIDFDANVRCFSKDEWKEIFDQAKQMEETEYKERLVKEFNPRLFNKPKELPTDEEIEKENPFAFGSKIFGTRDADAWEIGAKWTRDKIKGGDNE
jgi:hypothetical protein